MAGEDLPITDYKDLYFELLAQHNQCDEQIIALNTKYEKEIKSLGKQIVALEESYARTNAELDKTKNELKTACAGLEEANSKLKTATTELNNVKTELATAEKKLQIVRETVA
jgi:chromosome segregation ATPase